MEQETIDNLIAHVDEFIDEPIVQETITAKNERNAKKVLQQEILNSYGTRKTLMGRHKDRGDHIRKKVKTITEFLTPFSEREFSKKEYLDVKRIKETLNTYNKAKKHDSNAQLSQWLHVPEGLLLGVFGSSNQLVSVPVAVSLFLIGTGIAVYGVVSAASSQLNNHKNWLRNSTPYFDLYKNAAPKAANFLQSTYKNHLIEKGMK